MKTLAYNHFHESDIDTLQLQRHDDTLDQSTDPLLIILTPTKDKCGKRKRQQ